ncbi:peroxisome assembly protein (Peroxin-2) [Coemansia sp. BCRC 34490]|nr:peroxisome assembly protein (Peroxin-2) [Coemansia sp. Benny D160-2]KAJ2751134.1 peroxisome assembly protein (Peroxin-2) [Coemansia sp. BCRC 34490]
MAHSSRITLPPQQAPQQPWKHVWQQTAAQLSDADNGRGGAVVVVPRSGRVNKLDAELLDDEVAGMIRDPVSRAFSLVDSRFVDRYRNEVDAAIGAALFALSAGSARRRATYGQMVQNLEYARTGRGFAQRLWMLGLVTVVGRYAWRRVVAAVSARGWANEPSGSVRARAWRAVQRIERVARLAALVNLVVYMGAGQYRTIAERVLRLRLVSARPQLDHSVSFEFLNRQLVWHAFTEFVMFAVPLVNPARVRAWAARQLRAVVGVSAAAAVDPAIAALPDGVCAICATTAEGSGAGADVGVDADVGVGSGASQSPHRAVNPYVTPCAHTYCYVCIRTRMLAEADECACLRCGSHVDRIYQAC